MNASAAAAVAARNIFNRIQNGIVLTELETACAFDHNMYRVYSHANCTVRDNRGVLFYFFCSTENVKRCAFA